MPATTPPHIDPQSLRAARRALRVLQAGALAIVLAALPLPFFQLDRYTVPKELVLHLAAAAAGLLCLAAARRVTFFVVDYLLLAFLGLSALSALAAANGWAAFQAFGVSLSGIALFWTARSVARAGYGRPLLAMLAAAIVLAAGTALLQAYGLVTSPLFSPARAPGGTFGNRNFIAHIAAIGVPLLLFLAFEARHRIGAGLATLGLLPTVAALFLTRSRAGWLGAGISVAFLAGHGLWPGRLWHTPALRLRAIQLGTTIAVGVAGAWLVPNALNWRSDSPYLESLAGMVNYQDGSGRGRLIQYRNSLAMAWEHPWLGVGPGNWPVHYPRYMAPGDPSFDADDPIPTNPWPSSDWVAMLAERGIPATLLLVLIGVALGLGALTRIRRPATEADISRDLAIVATLLAIAAVGAFDAVVLLPAPAFFAWTILGALASSAQPVRDVALAPDRRRRRLIVGSIVAGILLLRTVARTIAMPIFDEGTMTEKRWAARIDPGNFRMHIHIAMEQRRRGNCKEAISHARAAYELFPSYPAPARVLRACGAPPPKP